MNLSLGSFEQILRHHLSVTSAGYRGVRAAASVCPRFSEPGARAVLTPAPAAFFSTTTMPLPTPPPPPLSTTWKGKKRVKLHTVFLGLAPLWFLSVSSIETAVKAGAGSGCRRAGAFFVGVILMLTYLSQHC